ncbi:MULTISPECIES: SLC13 family permease [Acidithiobacillus]|jgi:di/tricarboxylate transporter|uniref:Transporter n=2 Tax=Acidithiobacillus caldus TaxID=33059 RepID=F9ZTB0_ACICS|nr:MULTISPECIES: SLC13 family permease [Acidithiobacillus]AEK56933.1 putative transporter [Acidithiobacillus caldus SM-1]AUW31730.1 SLC13 family permease [Acidithiobacillus caldus]MBU2762098.1 SLC13 family permease [Acidithiobacillus caldus]MBU2770200.1 SLC13 family permease [Acidithiobacillus caldus]MBU2783165.1 SLC13 family permease [Acidithiobacillus caldus]
MPVDTPSIHAIAVMIIALLALVSYSRQNIPVATTSLGILVIIPLFFALLPMRVGHGTLDPTIFFQGFGNEALVAIVSLMVAGAAIVHTGALEPLGRFLSKVWNWAPPLALLLVLLVTAVLSAFVNDTPLVVLLIPLLTSIALRTNRPVSRMLMPLGFSALIGGMATTIGTSTNLVVVSVAQSLGLPPMGMFHFTLPAAIAGGVAMVYLWLIAPLLLPKRPTPSGDRSPRIFNAKLKLKEDSKFAGKTLAELRKEVGDLKVSRVQRGEQILVPFPDLKLAAGDELQVRDYADKLKDLEASIGAELTLGDKKVDAADKDKDADSDQQVVEVVILPASPLVGRTLKGSRFAARFDLTPLGIYRRGTSLQTDDLEAERLRNGDVVLVQGARERIAEIRARGDLTFLDASVDLPRSKKAPLALLIMLAIVLPAALNLLPIAVTAPVGVLLMIVTGCIEWRQVGGAISASVILLIAAGIALSMALVKTGAAHFLAQAFLSLTQGLPPTILVGLILFFVAFLGNVASHTTGALIGAPISVQIAHGLGLSPEPFLLAVLFGANLGYATPMAYQTNVLTMNAAGYTFMDFFRVGLPLLILMGVLISWMLPQFFPF